MKPATLLALFLLAACSDPSLNAGISIGAGGIGISPSVSGGVGDGRFSYSP